MKPSTLERLIDEILEDEALTQGLSESEAQELLTWLVGLLEEGEDEQDGAHVRALGKRIAKLAARYRVPVEELIELVELAWGELPQGESEDRPLLA